MKIDLKELFQIYREFLNDDCKTPERFKIKKIEDEKDKNYNWIMYTLECGGQFIFINEKYRDGFIDKNYNIKEMMGSLFALGVIEGERLKEEQIKRVLGLDKK